MTNEELSKRFDNPFTLVNYAISLAKTMILRGEEIDTNPAVDVINAIEEHRDLAIQEEGKIEEELDIEFETPEVIEELQFEK